jgi:DNA-directed RNA polymerase subunit RPC12/RpoP
VSGHEFLLLVAGLFWLSVAIAVAIDATRRGRQGGVWGITTFLLGPIGVALYVLAVLGAMAGSASSRTEEDGSSRYRVCPECGAEHAGTPDRCSACGERFGPGDEPPSARLIRSGSRAYCGNCRSRVGLDSERCPDCGSVF